MSIQFEIVIRKSKPLERKGGLGLGGFVRNVKPAIIMLIN